MPGIKPVLAEHKTIALLPTIHYSLLFLFLE